MRAKINCNSIDLRNVDWEKCLYCKSVNEKCGRFKRVIIDAQSKLIPKVQKSYLNSTVDE